MFPKSKISVSISITDNPDLYFTLRLKQGLYNERVVYDQTAKLFVVADIEGNFNSFCNLLHKGGVVNKYLKWDFGEGHLVIVGDCFDRGDQVMECLWLIYSLEERAKRKGGHVHYILGNHEIMNLNGDWRYIHPRYADRSSRKPSTALYDGNSELWRWLQTKNIIEKIGDILFVHGGISKELLQLKLTIPEINRLARLNYTKANEAETDPALKTILTSENSPLWYRGYYKQLVDESLIDDTLHQFDVSTIVTGHTQIDKVTSFFNGKVINVNTDHSLEISEALLIEQGLFYRMDQKGVMTRLK